MEALRVRFFHADPSDSKTQARNGAPRGSMLRSSPCQTARFSSPDRTSDARDILLGRRAARAELCGSIGFVAKDLDCTREQQRLRAWLDVRDRTRRRLREYSRPRIVCLWA